MAGLLCSTWLLAMGNPRRASRSFLVFLIIIISLHHYYLGTSGFARQFRELRDFLYAQPDLGVRLSITGVVDEERSDQFLVRVIYNGKEEEEAAGNQSSSSGVVYANYCQGQGIVVTSNDKIDLVERLQAILGARMGLDW